MRAVVYRGVNDLRLETVPVPRLGANELLVKVAVCGVCPTDIKKIQYGTVPPPRIFGHETAGTIVQIGSQKPEGRRRKPEAGCQTSDLRYPASVLRPPISDLRLGDRVALHHHVPCLDCHYCRHGSFAQCETYKRTGITAGFEPAGGGYSEYVRVMPFVLPGVVPIPARNSFLEGAMLEPVNTVLKAVERLALLEGDTVLVAGQGPIGLMFTRLLALRGMNVLATDLLPSRLRLAARFGARKVFAVASSGPDSPRPQSAASPTGRNGHDQLGGLVERLTRGRGLDAAVIAVPSLEVVRQAQELVRGAGQVLLFSHTKRGEKAEVDLATVCVDEKDLIGSYSADFTLQSQAARLIFTRQLDVSRLITHEFPLDQTAAAVELASHPTPDSLKVMVTQPQEKPVPVPP